MIRLARPMFDDGALEAVGEVLASGYLVQGERVAAFEAAVAGHAGRDHAVAVNSGTSALHLALLALGTAPGDVVVVATYSYTATANVIELCGAEPAFVDIRPDTFNIDPDALAGALRRLTNTSGKHQVRAIVPVHAFGQMADMAAIGQLADRYELPVVEDAACALGAARGGLPAGSCGALGCFSFHPRKAITTAEGGMTVTDDARLARRLRALRNHGLDPEARVPEFVMPGFNVRMSEIQAALGLSQIEGLAARIERRRSLAARYDELLRATDLQPPAVAAGAEHVYQSYVVLLPAAAADRRETLIQRLLERGIETGIGTWHMPLTRYFRERYGYRPGSFPVTDDVFARSLALPIHEALTESDQEEVVGSLLAVLEDLETER